MSANFPSNETERRRRLKCLCGAVRDSLTLWTWRPSGFPCSLAEMAGIGFGGGFAAGLGLAGVVLHGGVSKELGSCLTLAAMLGPFLLARILRWSWWR